MSQHPAPTGFGRYLRDAISIAGYATPSQFARRVGTDPSVILRWISGEQRPTIRSIERIAPVLGRTIHEMINEAYPDSLHGAESPGAAQPTNGPPTSGSLEHEIGQLLADDSPLSPADREGLRAALEDLLDGYRPGLPHRRSA